MTEGGERERDGGSEEEGNRGEERGEREKGERERHEKGIDTGGGDIDARERGAGTGKLREGRGDR